MRKRFIPPINVGVLSGYLSPEEIEKTPILRHTEFTPQQWFDALSNHKEFNLSWVSAKEISTKFDIIINTGDLTVYGTFPNETIQWFRKRKKSLSILGNTDKKILGILRGEKLIKPNKEEKRIMYFWTSQNLLKKNINYLKTLSEQSSFKIGKLSIGVFHGTPDDFEEELFPNTPERRFRELAKNSSYHVNIVGHSHEPFYKIVDGTHFINPGSVGRMFDGDSRASFAVLNVHSKKISVEHFRIPYPVEDIVKNLKKHGLPDIYAEMYRKGRKLN